MKIAIERTIALVTVSKIRPFVGAVFGVPDSGKSYFIDEVLKMLETQRLHTKKRENPYGDWNQYES
ncbi:MAG: hypothetical protein AABW89_02305 [Nanoarchaeota archaeon]